MYDCEYAFAIASMPRSFLSVIASHCTVSVKAVTIRTYELRESDVLKHPWTNSAKARILVEQSRMKSNTLP